MVTDEPKTHMAEPHIRPPTQVLCHNAQSLEPVHIQVIGAELTEHHDGNHDGP